LAHAPGRSDWAEWGGARALVVTCANADGSDAPRVVFHKRSQVFTRASANDIKLWRFEILLCHVGRS